MTDFRLDYFLLVSAASFGILQWAFAYNRLEGLLLLPRRLSLLAGPALTVAAFAWFFLSTPRNVPDTAAGLDGNEQAALFAAGVGIALLAHLLLSSLSNWSMVGRQEHGGLEALRGANYVRTAMRRLGELWRSWQRQTNERSSG
ncbi:MAG: hypothetical protein HY535_05890 [Chloroflexi bacterium]|nr:hypothetical protein [Chloroflexota bacterium]